MPIRNTWGSHQAKKMGRVLKTSMFERAEKITINGGTFAGSIVNHSPEATTEWMRSLQENTVAGAFHNSGERRDPPKCHPGTREVVIQEIMDWVRGSTRTEMQRFLWIYGPAGTGKSSTAQTIAELSEFYVPSPVPEVDVDFILKKLSRLLTGSHPSTGHKCTAVTGASYVGLAQEIFNSLTSPEMERNTDIIFVSNLFLAALKKIPGNVEMGKYLCDNQHRKYIDNMKPYATELRSAVDLYIKDVNFPGPEDLSILEYFPPPSIIESVLLRNASVSNDPVAAESCTPPPSALLPPIDKDPKTTEPTHPHHPVVTIIVQPEKKKARGLMGNLLKRVFSFQKSKSP